MHLRRAAACGALAGAALLACATNPATGARQLVLISESSEIQMGLAYDSEVTTTLGLYPDPALQAYVQALGARLAAVSERPNLPWTFRVIDDPVVNAFALPGGHVYVTRGILAHLESEAQLAAVLGHEIGHVTARHSVTQLSRQELVQFGFAVGTAVKPELERYASAASAAFGVLFLKFSRDDESEADHLGLRYMRRAHYDPRQMPGVFTMLDRVSAAEGGGRIPEWLSTHPNPTNRRGRITAEIDSAPPAPGDTLVRSASYVDRLDGLVFGDDPRDGYFKGATFIHPVLRFTVRFPDGWATANQRRAVTAVSGGEDAAVEVSLADAATPEAGARAFFADSGVTGTPYRDVIGGLPAAGGDFSAATSQGTLRGTVAFIAYRGAMYRLLGYTTAAQWANYRTALGAAVRSFAPVTDSAVLAVQPWRVRVLRLDRAASLDDLAKTRVSPATAATLAIVNQTDAATRLAAGARVKWIAGNPLP